MQARHKFKVKAEIVWFSITHVLDTITQPVVHENGDGCLKKQLVSISAKYRSSLVVVLFFLYDFARLPYFTLFQAHVLFRQTQGRSEGVRRNSAPGVKPGGPKISNNVVSTFFNKIHLLPKYLNFRELVWKNYPGARHLISVRPWTDYYELSRLVSTRTSQLPCRSQAERHCASSCRRKLD